METSFGHKLLDGQKNADLLSILNRSLNTKKVKTL